MAIAAVAAVDRKGQIKKAHEVKCQCCGARPAQSRHHADYRKPLEVIYLCARCHKALHRELGWGTGGRIKGKQSEQPYNLELLVKGSYAIIPKMGIQRASQLANWFKKFGMKFKCFTYENGVVIFRTQ